MSNDINNDNDNVVEIIIINNNQWNNININKQ